MPKAPFAAWWVRRLLLDRIGSRQPDVGVFVTGLMTGATVEINPEKPFVAASVAKVPTAMAILHLATRGHISLDDTVTYHEGTDFEGGAGSLQGWIQEGQKVGVRYLLDQLIRVSDNIAWHMLQRYIGVGTISQYVRSLGVGTPYDDVVHKLTPRDANTLLLKLNGMQAGISPALTRSLIDLMATTIYRDRIPAKLPSNVYVAEKVGTLEGLVHDVGLVYASQRSFAISVFTKNMDESTGEDLIADLAARVYWYEDWLVTACGA